MEGFIIEYTVGRKNGAYFIREFNKERALNIFKHSHPSANIVNIIPKTLMGE